MINFVLWKWRQEGFREAYTAAHVNALVEALREKCKRPFRVFAITDDNGAALHPHLIWHPLWVDFRDVRNISGGHLPSCYRRLKIFDTKTTDAIGIPRGEKVVSLDLDAVIVRKDFGELFDREELFVGWHVPGHRHKTVFNGSMYMFRAGTLQWLWDQFDVNKSPVEATSKGFMGSDQGYLSHRLIGRDDVGGWTFLKDGVASYTRDVRLPRKFSEERCRVVFFAGRRKPWHSDVLHESNWIKRYANYDQQPARPAPTEPAHAAL